MMKRMRLWLTCAAVSLVIGAMCPLQSLADPVVDRLRPNPCEPAKVIRIRGSGFGTVKGKVHIGKKTFDASSSRIMLWTDTRIRFRVPPYKTALSEGGAIQARVWVTTQQGVESNRKRLQIVKPAIWTQILHPDGDSDVNWDASGGTAHHALVADDSDDTYVETGLGQQADYYTFGDPNVEGVPVAVRLWMRGRSFDSGHRAVRLALYMNGTKYAEKIELTDAVEDYYMEWERNPASTLSWEWSDIANLVAGVISPGRNGPGGRVSKLWLEVVCGMSAEKAFLTHGPVFGGVTQDTIKVWTRASKASRIAIRYGTSEDDVKRNRAASQTTVGMHVDSSTDDTSVATISGLDSETRYFFDVLVDDNSTYAFESPGNPNWRSLPYCDTFPQEDTDSEFRFVIGGDIHGPALNYQVFASMASKNPAFYIDLGDHTSDISDDLGTIRSKYQQLRTLGITGRHLVANILRRMPMFRTWSDHDAFRNNCHKFGTGGYGESFDYGKLQNSLDGFKEYTPMPALAAPSDMHGIATGGDADTLIDATAPFDDTIYPGMVVSKTTGPPAYSFVESVDSSSQITLHGSLSGGKVFENGVGYRIHRGGLWHRFKFGNAEFFVIDARYKRDPNGTPGGDMLDGRRYGSPPKALGTSTDEQPYRLIDDRGDFTSSVNQGDVVMNMTAGTYALITEIDGDFEVSLNEDIMKDGQDYEVFESGGTVGGSGHVQRGWLVGSVNNSTAKWKFILCESAFLHDETTSRDKWADYDPLGALRDYLVKSITAENVIWCGADRHFAALDDGANEADPWPSVATANASCTQGENPTGSWRVNNEVAEWSADDGAKGGFSLITVRSDRVEAECYQPDGSLVNNGTIDLKMIVPWSGQ